MSIRTSAAVVAAVFAATLSLAPAGAASAASEREAPARKQPAPHPPAPPAASHPPPNRWYDRSHDHRRYYPPAGQRLRSLPPRAGLVVWPGARFWFLEGVWYAPAAAGYVVVRPPFGIVVPVLPPFRTAVVIGGLTYFYLNGVYYRERAEGGYEVVPPPVTGIAAPTGSAGRLYVYPRLGQTPEKQATDEYECHRWAVTQSGFDPAPAAAGQATDTSGRADYVRAQTACLEARGYTVR
jgi:hypothetical protein